MIPTGLGRLYPDSIDPSTSPRVAARFAAVVLLAGAAAGLLSDRLITHHAGPNDAVAAATGIVGVAAWLLPWQRWPRRATLALAFAGLGLIATSRALGSDPVPTFVLSFVMVFMWVGLTQPPGAAFVLAGPAIAAYLVPVFLAPNGSSTEAQSLAIVLPMLLIVGEVPARMLAALAQARDAERHSAMLVAQEARTDALTGLGNRRFGERLLGTLTAGDALLLMDLDHFKAVNDRFGHAAGDRVLREFGAYLRGAIRGDDCVARFGGEEFLIVVRGPGRDAAEVARRIADGWHGQDRLVTLSIGVSVHDGCRSVAETYGQADTALYWAKSHGRNQVRLFDPEDRRAPEPGRFSWVPGDRSAQLQRDRDDHGVRPEP